MSNKVTELLDLLRESDSDQSDLSESSHMPTDKDKDYKKSDAFDREKAVSAHKASEADLKKAAKKSDAFDREKAVSAHKATSSSAKDNFEKQEHLKSQALHQRKASKYDLSEDADLGADDEDLTLEESEDELDSEIAEIIQMMGEAKKEKDEDEEEEEDEEGEEEGEEDPEKADYNDVDGLGLSEEERKGVMDQASAKEGAEQGEAESEDKEPVPGTEDLDVKQKMMIRRLFDECVKEVADAKLAKAVKLTEEVLTRKFKEFTLAREEKLSEQVSHYLEYVVETWRKQNEPKLYTAAQVKVAQKIFESVKTLVETFDIETVDVSAQLIDMYESKLGKLEAQSNKLVAENAALVKEVSLRDRALIIEEASKGLPLTEVENFKAVVAKIKAEDLDTFKENVSAMKNSFMPKTAKKIESITEANETLALQGGISRKESPAVKADADFIAKLIPMGVENNK